MRFPRFGLLLFIPLLNMSIRAQQTQPSTAQSGVAPRLPGPDNIYSPPEILSAAVRDPQALDVVQKALAAMGGSAIAGIRDCTIQAQGDVPSGSQAIRGKMTWRMAGAEFRIDAPGPTGTASVMTGHGKPAAISGTATPLQFYVTQAIFAPVTVAPVLAQEMQNPKMSLRFKDIEILGSASVMVVMTALETDYPDNVVTPQTWYFDSITGLPIRIEFRSPDIHQPTNYVPSAVDLSNYQWVSGTAFPFKVVSYADGQTQFIFTVESVVVNSGIAPSVFDSTGSAL